MKVLEILVSIGLIIVCLTWSVLKISDAYLKKTTPVPKLTQPITEQVKSELKPIEGVAPWVSDLVNLSITNPEKFKFDGFTWNYNKTAVWVANGAEHVEMFYRQDVELTKLEKVTLYNAFTNWNKENSLRVKLNYKID